MKKMAWRRSYDFTPRVEESEFDSSDESDSEGGTESLKLYHRRKSTVTAVRSKVRFSRFCCCKYFYTGEKCRAFFQVKSHANVLLCL